MGLETLSREGGAVRRGAAHLFKSLTRSVRQQGFNREAFSGLPPEERQKFELFGQGVFEQVPYDVIHHAIEKHSHEQADKIAARHLDQQISYGELNQQAERLSAELSLRGIGRGDNVGLFVERSIPMLVGILAILKTGAAYVPQDARITPATQLDQIIESADIRVILTLSHLQESIPVGTNREILTIDQMLPEANNGRIYLYASLPKTAVQQQDDCFVLFTSGTTGRPNGVRVTHGNVCNILLTEPGSLGMKPGSQVSQLLNIAFDMAAWEILGCLAHGATLVIRGKDFNEAAQQADVIIATPSILGTIDADLCNRVRTVAVAGEPCPRPLADKWAARCRFYNGCGPTETTIINTAQHYCSSSPRLTIGKPTPNNTVYILDEHMQPCRVGEVGEIWAGGAGVTAGYINNPQLNQDRYRLDPFLNNGSQMFRTRDLGRWTDDGELEHFGRTDDQVKVRGFRVELDSVSAVMEGVEGCQQAVTLKLDDNNLVSFVRPAVVDLEHCRQAVAAALPYYCIPATVVALDHFPMTSRGKVDKRALLENSFENSLEKEPKSLTDRPAAIETEEPEGVAS
ncbi:MAG: amino acid adenylation domain-containing protein [Endozoicomonas sp.]